MAHAAQARHSPAATTRPTSAASAAIMHAEGRPGRAGTHVAAKRHLAAVCPLHVWLGMAGGGARPPSPAPTGGPRGRHAGNRPRHLH